MTLIQNFKKKLAFAMILSGKNQSETAAALSVSRRTINHWLSSDEYKIIFEQTYQNTINNLQALLLTGFTVALKHKVNLAVQGEKDAIDFFAKGLMNNLALKNDLMNNITLQNNLMNNSQNTSNKKLSVLDYPKANKTLDDILEELDNHLRTLPPAEIDALLEKEIADSQKYESSTLPQNTNSNNNESNALLNQAPPLPFTPPNTY